MSEDFKERMWVWVKMKFYSIVQRISGHKLIIDSGVRLTPGNEGRSCQGNGMHYDVWGNIIECCCDEYPYMMCCLSDEEARFHKNIFFEFYRKTCRHCDNKICEFSPAYLWRYPYKKL